MKKRIIVFILCLLIILGAGFNNPFTESSINAAQNREIILTGSGNCIPIVTKLAESFNGNSSLQIKVPPSIGTRGAVAAVKKGSLSIGLTSRPLKDDEKRAGIHELKFATIAIVFGVHPDVPDTNITGPEIVDIFNGKKNLWQNGKTIVVINREEGDSTIAVLQKKIEGFEDAYNNSIREKRWAIVFTDKEAHETIARTKNSFGFCDSTIIAVPLNIKMLRFNQVEPSLEKVQSGRYPFSKDLFFIFKGKSLPEEARGFINFIQSPKGAKTLMVNGALPTGE